MSNDVGIENLPQLVEESPNLPQTGENLQDDIIQQLAGQIEIENVPQVVGQMQNEIVPQLGAQRR